VRVTKRNHLLLNKRERLVDLSRSLRKDNQKPEVFVSEKRLRSFAKYKVTDVPFPYTSSEDYERSLQIPVGG
jgi:U3 small nucleolar RNA-associated protein 14